VHSSRSPWRPPPLCSAWKELEAVKAGHVHDVADEIWMTSVSVQVAHLVLDDLARTFGVDPARS
jgi:iron complex transport system substrate-binding protein